MSDEQKPAVPTKPEPTPGLVVNNGPSLVTLIVALCVSSAVSMGLLFGGMHYLQRDVQPGPAPAPVVVVPVKVDHADAIATLNGIRLDAERTKLLCDLVNAGDGTFVLRYQPVGKPELTRTIVVSGGDKPPLPPVPPGPVPPNPPGPTPDPDELPPIPNEGFRAMIIYENNPKTEAERMPPSQQAILGSPVIRSYLDSKCAKGQDGKTPEWRMVEQHDDLSNESNIWKLAMALPRASVPWIVVSDGKRGTSEPLPKTEAETLALLKKYGGN